MTLPDPTTAPPWWVQHGVEPTDLEMADWLHRTSDANRTAWFDRVRRNSTEAERCWMQSHDDQIEQLRSELTAARARVEWLERNYRQAGPRSCA